MAMNVFEMLDGLRSRPWPQEVGGCPVSSLPFDHLESDVELLQEYRVLGERDT